MRIRIRNTDQNKYVPILLSRVVDPYSESGSRILIRIESIRIHNPCSKQSGAEGIILVIYLVNITRHFAGTYRCKADNGFSEEGSVADVRLIVEHK
jgi:hypothetical protein